MPTLAAGRRSFLSSLVLIAAALAACESDPAGPLLEGEEGSAGFTGVYAAQNWSHTYMCGSACWTSSGISGGTTSIEPGDGNSDQVALAYNVDLGNPGGGVSQRTATFSQLATATGEVSFDWAYTGFHAFFQVNAELTVFAERSGGTTTIVEVNQAAGGNSFSFSGSTTITVEAGRRFGIIVGGRNFDSNSRLRGTVEISNLSGAWGGSPTVEDLLGDGSQLALSYDVNLGNPSGGVSQRNVTFSAIAGATGIASFDWDYSGFHAFFQVNADLTVFADGPIGRTTLPLVDQAAGGSSFSFNGSTELPLTEGFAFGIIVGGRNFDSNSRLRGAVALSNLEIN